MRFQNASTINNEYRANSYTSRGIAISRRWIQWNGKSLGIEATHDLDYKIIENKDMAATSRCRHVFIFIFIVSQANYMFSAIF